MRKTRRKNASEIIEKSVEIEAKKWEYDVPVGREKSVQEMKESGRKVMKKEADKQVKKERK